jgi:ribonucleotide monophosphatase NagD (HAD superfamily)
MSKGLNLKGLKSKGLNAKGLNAKGLVLDMDGVFYVDNELISGAENALLFLREKNIPFRFIINTTTRNPEELVEKLEALGLNTRPDEIFTAVTATVNFLKLRGDLSCFL